MSEILKDIKSSALQMELDGIKFYNDLAEKTFHPLGKAMFKSFVEDEKLHVKRLKTILSDKRTSQTDVNNITNPKERLTTIFQKMGDELKKKVNPSTNDIDAIELAIEIEENGVMFYEKSAKEAMDAKEKEVYRFLAGEEKTHLDILKNALEYIQNTELWEAEKEPRIYEMWINMINKKDKG
jgi:rubrerythrin